MYVRKMYESVTTVAVLPIGQYSLLADSHSWSKSLKFGIDINKRSKILFYQLAKDFEVILPIGRRVAAFSWNAKLYFISEGDVIKIIKSLQIMFYFLQNNFRKKSYFKLSNESQNIFLMLKGNETLIFIWFPYVPNLVYKWYIRILLPNGKPNPILTIGPILVIGRKNFDQ